MAKLPMYVKRAGLGFQVAVPGKRSQFFSDAEHGGRALALLKAAGAAQRLADKSRANPRTGRFVRAPSKAAGVFRQVVTRKRGGKRYRYARWIAKADVLKGKAKQVAFSVSKYGEEGAKEKAREERRKMIRGVLK